MTGAEEMRQRAKDERASLLEDAAYFRTLPPYKLDRELTGCDAIYLRRLAMVINVPHRYDEDMSLKPKDVMIAALYEALSK